MINLLPDSYTVHVSLTKGRQILMVAPFTKPEAQEALKLLSAAPEVRFDTSCALKQMLETGKPITLNGVSLHRRVAMLLALACLLHSGQLEEVKLDLERIVRGVTRPGEILKPFLWNDGFRPKGRG